MTLGLRVRRAFFDSLVAQAVPSTWQRHLYATQDEWSKAVSKSSVRLQWDPDHDPKGNKRDRRAIQLGLRGEVLRRFGQEEIVEVIDLTAFVAEQRDVLLREGISALQTPVERVYRPDSN